MVYLGRLLSKTRQCSKVLGEREFLKDVVKMAINIGGMRKPYLGAGETFDLKDLVAKEPYAQFSHWFDQAKSTPGIEEPNAMCIATATKAGLPSARYVLLKVSVGLFSLWP